MISIDGCLNTLNLAREHHELHSHGGETVQEFRVGWGEVRTPTNGAM